MRFLDLFSFFRHTDTAMEREELRKLEPEPKPRVEFHWEVTGDMLIITCPKLDYHYSLDVRVLCREFREGRGYEHISVLIRCQHASGESWEFCKRLEEFLRAWGHTLEKEY